MEKLIAELDAVAEMPMVPQHVLKGLAGLRASMVIRAAAVKAAVAHKPVAK